MNLINLKGTIELGNCLPNDAYTIKEVLKSALQEGLEGVTIEEDVIFINSTFNNDNLFAENLAVLVSSKLPIGHEDLILECIGDNLSDRYDIVIKSNKVYIQEYEFVPGELTLYSMK